ncbi:hypothetical protein KUV64_15285 [Mameliella alba]|uniref:hypothetical protein n=1 Tax=Mameliella alba TaxID=561184 RepID=UPI001C94C4BE|nr:hypothetical protein [Mameliella alba]MBY6120493.1 hypothetical protein [Mameliella alba]
MQVALYRDLSTPTDPDQFSEPASAILVAFIHPHRVCGMSVAGVDANHRQADPPEFMSRPI